MNEEDNPVNRGKNKKKKKLTFHRVKDFSIQGRRYSVKRTQHANNVLPLWQHHKERLSIKKNKYIPDILCTCTLKQPLLLPSGHGSCSS